MSDDLVVRAKGGDRAAFERLVEKHMPAVYRLATLRLGWGDPAVEDVVQDVLVGATQSIKSLRGDDEPALVAWLLTITRYKVADHLRERYALRADSVATLPAVADSVLSPEDVAAARARQAELREALARLTPEQEEILVLKFVLGYENEEIAAITGRTVGAVKSMQHRGLASMERQLRIQVETWTA